MSSNATIGERANTHPGLAAISRVDTVQSIRHKLTKDQIIHGAVRKSKMIPMPEWGEDVDVEIWSLTSGQWAEVEAVRSRGLDLNIDGLDMSGKADRKDAMKSAAAGMRLDLAEMTRAEYIADAQAVAYALSGSGDTWSLDEALAITPPSAVKKLAQEVYNLSGVTPEDIKSLAAFRGDAAQ